MELLSVIRRWRHRDDFSIREISRRSGLSRNTVRKYLRADSVEPQFMAPDRPSKLDPYADNLSAMLRVETGKSRKQKRTIKQLHADLAVGLFNGQDELLLMLEDGTSRTVSDLARILGVRPPTISKMLDRLVENDLVAKGSGDDKRQTIITLTRSGFERRKEIASARIQLEAEFQAGSEAGTLAETKAVLIRTEDPPVGWSTGAGSRARRSRHSSRS